MSQEGINKEENKEVPKQKVVFVDDDFSSAEDAWALEAEDTPIVNFFDVAYVSKFTLPEKAVDDVLKNNPAVVIMDNDLRRGSNFSGAEVVRALRDAGFTGAIVGNSGSGSTPFDEKGVSSMMNGFLPAKNEGIRDFLEKLQNKS